MAGRRPALTPLVWGYIALVLAFLYVPLIPPILFSFEAGGGGAGALRWYAQIWRNPILTSSMLTTLKIGIAVALAATVLGLAAAMAIRELRAPRLVLLLMLLPVFIPGVSMGLATAFFFRQLGLAPSLLTIAIVLAGLIAGSIFYQAVRLGRTMYQVLEIVAQQIGLAPMGSNS